MVTRRGGITGIVPLAGDEPVLSKRISFGAEKIRMSTVVEGPEPTRAAWGDAA